MNSDWFAEKGERIQALRKNKFPKDTQKTFAARVGVGLTTIQNLEAGKEGVSWGTCCKVLSLLGKEQALEALFKESTLELRIKDKVTSW